MQNRFVCILCLCAALFLAWGCTPPQLTVQVYRDADRDSLSDRAQTIFPPDVPLAGVPVLLTDGRTERTLATGGDGIARFDAVDPGTYLVLPQADPGADCTSNNQPRRLLEAIREGDVNIVSIGDSVSALGSDRLWCERLAERISEMAPASCTPLAVDGATTYDWLPGGSGRGFFESRLLPVIDEADMVTVTVGANDLYWYILGGPPYIPEEILQRIIDHPEYLLHALPNTVRVLEEIRARNPACDIVYVIYWNVANSDIVRGILGEYADLGNVVVKNGIAALRVLVSEIDGVVLADVFGALGDTRLDPYLLDEAHPNGDGHQLHADEAFRALGGIVVEPGDTAPQNRKFGFDR